MAGWQIMEGDDSPNVFRHKTISTDLQGETPPVSTAWRTAVDQIPRNLDADAFEDWL